MEPGKSGRTAASGRRMDDRTTFSLQQLRTFPQRPLERPECVLTGRKMVTRSRLVAKSS